MKKTISKILKVIGTIILILYIAVCVWFYNNQESLIFFPEKLEADYKFEYEGNFDEINIKTPDGVMLNTLLFKNENPSGVVLYLHGQGGSLKNWYGALAKVYAKANYDALFMDYRGYGKSGGEISNEKQFYNDIQVAYDYLKNKYTEEKIVVIGNSLGTTGASWVASKNSPIKLILIAPLYSIPDMMNNFEPMKYLKIIPSFLVKYKFKNYENIEKVHAPISIMHGDQDNFIYYGSSLKLKEHFKPGDNLITIKGGGHGIGHDSEEVKSEIQRILNTINP